MITVYNDLVNIADLNADIEAEFSGMLNKWVVKTKLNLNNEFGKRGIKQVNTENKRGLLKYFVSEKSFEKIQKSDYKIVNECFFK